MIKPPKIEFRNVSLAYGDHVVLDGISFRVESGEMKVVLGQSGSGKSTILRLAIGLLKPDSGQIILDGEDITSMSDDDLAVVRRRMSFVFQEGALFNSLTVYDNIAYRPRELGWSEDRIELRVGEVLQFVDLEDVADRLPGGLSGGTQRRVAIARAIVDSPDIIFYDEPTVGLDPQTAHKLCEAAVRLRDLEGVTSLFVTHKLDDLRFLSSRYFLINHSGIPEMHDKTDRLCLTNTKFLMLRKAGIAFDGTIEQMSASEDPFLRDFMNIDEEP